MKLGNLIEYSMKNIYFFKNDIQNVADKLFTDPFLKTQN